MGRSGRSGGSKASGQNKKSPPKPASQPIGSESESEDEEYSMKRIQKSLDTILTKMETMQSDHEKLEKLVTDKGGIQDEISEVQENLGATSDDLETLKTTVKSQQKEITVLKNLVIHMSNKIEYQEKHISDLRTRSMHPNILIHGLEEKPDEDLYKVIADHMKDNFDIENIHFSSVQR